MNKMRETWKPRERREEIKKRGKEEKYIRMIW